MEWEQMKTAIIIKHLDTCLNIRKQVEENILDVIEEHLTGYHPAWMEIVFENARSLIDQLDNLQNETAQYIDNKRKPL